MRAGAIKRGSLQAPKRPPTIETKPRPRIAAVERSMTVLAELDKQLARMLRGVFVPALAPPAPVERPWEVHRDSNLKDGGRS
jgi:hypothetical protein